jgi:hypothetical protein
LLQNRSRRRSSSSASATTTTAGLSPTDLATKANAACDTYFAALMKPYRPADFRTNPVSAAAFLDMVVRIEATEYNTFTALTPAKFKADYAAFLVAAKHLHTVLATADAKAHAKDPSGFADLTAGNQYHSATFDPIARKLGFTSCDTP